ncbi:MAG: L17 family ribosomal protein [Candidatus Shapirobacteria bacterium]|nr:L17 family ribosomal protein [Candidatus Shapirobacteria bacterium]MDD3003134.1 L17 family ribosomal protein [Candidatus Shapirobacteria bacterium]MDD4383109.1 L17 family ribosomal protein [Candidatus Shapirobacteria bacterium]
MKHRIAGKKLHRNFDEKRALLRSLTRAMFTHGAIETTDAKVKAVVPMVEKLANIIMTKEELTAKRELFRVLQDQHWVNRVVANFKSVFGDQTSNFTTIQKIKRRYGDDALIVKFSFVKAVNFKPEIKEEVKKETKKIIKKVAVKKEKPAKKVKAVKKESK